MKIEMLDTVETPMKWYDEESESVKTQVLVLKLGQTVDLAPHPGWVKCAQRLIDLGFAKAIE